MTECGLVFGYEFMTHCKLFSNYFFLAEPRKLKHENILRHGNMIPISVCCAKTFVGQKSVLSVISKNVFSHTQTERPSHRQTTPSNRYYASYGDIILIKFSVYANFQIVYQNDEKNLLVWLIVNSSELRLSINFQRERFNNSLLIFTIVGRFRMWEINILIWRSYSHRLVVH